jgi:Heterokaryon incompatibility protein (HET)
MMSDDDAGKYIPRSINTRTASDKAFQLAQQWLKECLSSHPDCNLKNTPFKPTRLVQIIQASASWPVRLIRPSLAVNYVALSYCWGGTQATLTKSVEKSWETSIDKGQLLQTIQDAIYVTMRLGIEYIWIDSLCIIQEDSIEKSQEIAKMADVYSSATFTLAASSAATAHEGFLQDRHVTDFPEEVFDLPYKCPNGHLNLNRVTRGAIS